MYEGLYSPLPDSGLYLERIGLGGVTLDNSVESLSRLVGAQLTHIPFDVLDVWHAKKTPSLNIEDIFNKIIVGRRGGYCFELNTLFCSLLKSLGFDAYLVFSRFAIGIDYLAPTGHTSVICRIGGEKYFCDVGFGGSVPRGAVKINGGESSDGFTVASENGQCLVKSAKLPGNGRFLTFKDEPVDPVDFIYPNYYFSHCPETPFVNQLLINLRTPTGSVSLDDKELRISDRGNVEVIPYEGTDRREELLKEYFNIVYKF